IPPAERAIGRSRHECQVEPQDCFQFVFDRLAIFESSPDAEGLGERSHVRGDPEMALWTIRLQRHRLSARLDSPLEKRAPFRLTGVFSEPVVDPRQLPGGVECRWTAC